jgi:hypothetical protein
LSLTYEFPKVVTLSSTDKKSFELNPYSRYNFKIYINNPKVNNTITFYDSGGNALDPINATSDTEIVVRYGYYQRVEFSDSNSYTIKMIVQKLVFSSPEEASCCPPQVDISASQAGVARADQFIQDAVGNLQINLAAISTTANLNVNIAAWNVGTISVNIAAQSVGNLAVNLAAISTTTNLNVNIAAQSGNINVNLAASSITLNVQGTIAVTLGTTTYQSIPISIVGQQIGNLAVNIAAQSVGNLAVNIAAQSVGNLNVNIAAQSGNINVNLAASAITLNVQGTIAVTLGTTTYQSIPISIVGQQIGNLAIDIKAQSVGNLNVNIAAQSGNISVNLAASSVTLTVTGTSLLTQLQGYTGTAWKNIAVDASGNMAVNIAAQSVGNLAVNIAAWNAGTINVNISSQSGNINVNLAASAITLNVNVTNATINISGSVTLNAGTAIVGSINQIVSPVTSRSKIVSGYQESAVFLNNGANGLFLSGSNADSQSNYLIQQGVWNRTNVMTGSFLSNASYQTVAVKYTNGASQLIIQGIQSYIVVLTGGAAPYSFTAVVNIRAALYSDSSGSPGSLIAQTLINQFSLTGSGNSTYINFPVAGFFSSPQTLAASTAYWVVLTVGILSQTGNVNLVGVAILTSGTSVSNTSNFVTGFPTSGGALGSNTGNGGYFVLLSANTNTTTAIPAANLAIAAATTLNGQIVFKLGLTTDSGGVVGVTSLQYTIKDTTTNTVLATNTLNVNLFGIGAVTITDTRSLGATTLNAGDNLQVVINSITWYAGPQDGSNGVVNVYLDNTNGTSYVVMPLQ